MQVLRELLQLKESLNLEANATLGDLLQAKEELEFQLKNASGDKAKQLQTDINELSQLIRVKQIRNSQAVQH